MAEAHAGGEGDAKGKDAHDLAQEDLEKKYVIKVEHTDMTEEMQEELKTIVREAFSKYTVYKDLATHVKQAFDTKYPPPDNKATSGVYHCVVGALHRCVLPPRPSGVRFHRVFSRLPRPRREQLRSLCHTRDSFRMPPEVQQHLGRIVSIEGLSIRLIARRGNLDTTWTGLHHPVPHGRPVAPPAVRASQNCDVAVRLNVDLMNLDSDTRRSV